MTFDTLSHKEALPESEIDTLQRPARSAPCREDERAASSRCVSFITGEHMSDVYPTKLANSSPRLGQRRRVEQKLALVSVG